MKAFVDAEHKLLRALVTRCSKKLESEPLFGPLQQAYQGLGSKKSKVLEESNMREDFSILKRGIFSVVELMLPQ